MLPNIPSSSQQPLLPPSIAQNGSSDASMPFNLDPYTAKQMAALQATSLAKAGNRSAPGGTSAPYFGGMSLNSPLRPDPSSNQDLNPTPMPGLQNFPTPGQQHQNPHPNHPNPALMQQSLHQRKRSFLTGLANIQAQRNTPLPPALTGVQYPPGYDPTTSPWLRLDVSPAELGTIRLAGQDVDIFRLWALVLQSGGGARVSSQGMWSQVARLLELPEQIQQQNGQVQSIAPILQHHYTLLIGPFEDAYRRNVRDQQQRTALAARGQPGMPLPTQGRTEGIPGIPGTVPPQMNPMQRLGGTPNLGGIASAPFPPSVHPQQGPNGLSATPDIRSGIGPMGATEALANAAAAPPSQSTINGLSQVSGELNPPDLDQDPEGRKRKSREAEDLEGKRARQRTNGSDSSDPRSSIGPTGVNPHAATRTVRQPSRRKIEYIPFAREADTAGGRDLDSIHHELNAAAQRPLKSLDDWGTVDIDALTMSIRSRLSTELSYALTTFTLLTLMRGPFTASQAPDLFEEVLDLLEEVGFNGEKDEGSFDGSSSPRITTHREILNALVDDGSQPFASLRPKAGQKDPDLGPRQRPGDLILAVMNILRNLSVTPENQEYLAKHNRLLDILLRLCSVSQSTGGPIPPPVSPALSYSDLVTVRKDTVHIILNMGFHIRFPPEPTPQTLRLGRRLFELLASYLTDPSDSISPFAFMLQSGISGPQHYPKPSSAVDLALEAFIRVSQPDDNRHLFSKAIPKEWIWLLFGRLVHRLPVADNDFSVVMRETWLAYFERLMMLTYSIAFLAPPEIKMKIKTDRQLAFPKVMLRILKRIGAIPADYRQHFFISVRRGIEMMKLVDDAADAFDTSQSAVPTLTFGMGYGEHGEAQVEKGMGLLSGYQEDVTWGLMMQRDVDDLMFNELISLVRVG